MDSLIGNQQKKINNLLVQAVRGNESGVLPSRSVVFFKEGLLSVRIGVRVVGGKWEKEVDLNK